VATSLPEIVLFRLIQGLAGASLIPLSQTVMLDIFPPKQIPRVMSIWSAAVILGPIIGPALGGWLTENLSWRWVFYINLPIGAVALVVVAAVLPKMKTRIEHKIDYLGSAVLSAAVVCLVLALTWGGVNYGWTSTTIITLFVATVALLAAFVQVEKRAVEPLVPLHLFRNQVFRVSFGTGAMIGFAMFGALTFLPLFLQVVHGASPTSSGLQMAPMMAFVLAMAIISGRRISATGTYRRFPIAGTSILIVALFLFSHLSGSTPFWQTALYMALMGTGLGLTMQVLLLSAQNSVNYEDLGVATSMAAFGRSIGGSIGVAMFGTVFNNRLAADLTKQIGQIPASVRANPVVSHAIASLHGTSVTANPSAVRHLPAVVRTAVQSGFSDSLHVVFIASLPIGVLALIGALRLKEVPLRAAMAPPAQQGADSEGEELGEAFGMQVPEAAALH
jgi:EmrB/QacA subfamily drug resistance transporter